MKKPTLKRILLGIVQHLLAASGMIALAMILFHSYLTVQTMDGPKTYALSPLNSDSEFEDSQLFQDIFQTSVVDITRLVVIKSQLETNGEFDSDKLIDVTSYVQNKDPENDCPITAVYELEDLIKWGKNGLEYTNRAMSMSEFVNYFGNAVSPYNFRVDEEGELAFVGFLDNSFSPEIRRYYSQAASVNTQPETEELTAEELEAIQNAILRCTEDQVEDMVFSYILANVEDGIIDVTREDDGTITVYFPLLSGRYETTDKEKQLTAYAGNWVDYFALQSNVETAVTDLSEYYQLYQNCNSIYQASSNLKYVVRTETDEGELTYTNLEGFEDWSESEITNYFLDYRRYFIYFPDSLEFTGNTSLTEQDIRNYLSEYAYAYPDTTHIWVGVDTSYSTTGDAFYSAYYLFKNIVPNITGILVTIAFLAILWLFLLGHLTASAGIAYDAAEEKHRYLSPIDHLWTEFELLLAAGCGVAGYYGYLYLMSVANTIYENHVFTLGITESSYQEYLIYAGYGFTVSFAFCVLWYSLVRRIKYGNLWRESFLHWLLGKLRQGMNFVLTHRNSAVSTLLPYNVFLLINLAGIIGVLVLAQRLQILWAAGVLAAVLIALDGVIGVILYRRNGEWIDIAEGIRRIRDGEVEYKLDLENLHGSNREIGDAVNHIGEGISKAVHTSMKDEQMKTDLITNVSHDIKTPLTSIISYVDLLKRLKLEEEPAKSYIDVLDTKAQRLKQLTDDLVEASKISSGNLELNMERINLGELMNQTVGELSERLEEKGLQLVLDVGKDDTTICADSRRMWRVMENLLNNVYKYALENTRVYIDLWSETTDSGRMVCASVKNISEQQMNIKADDLTERFIRGDASRTTEGSGLGLYISKNLIKAQGGTFTIELDGDLFKVVMRFAAAE